MRTLHPRRLAPAIAAVALLAAAPSPASAQSARESASNVVAQFCSPEVGNQLAYWLGSTFEGLPSSTGARVCQPEHPTNPALGANNHISFLYGDCAPPLDGVDGVEAHCLPPLEIQTAPYAERNRTRYRLDGGTYPSTRVTLANTHLGGLIDGAYSFDGGTIIEIYVDDLTISVFGNDAAQVRRAADAVRRVPRTRVGVPEPARGPLEDAGVCSERPAPRPGCDVTVPDAPKAPVENPVDVSTPSTALLIDEALRQTLDVGREHALRGLDLLCRVPQIPGPVRDAACIAEGVAEPVAETSPRAVVDEQLGTVDDTAYDICRDPRMPGPVKSLGCLLSG